MDLAYNLLLLGKPNVVLFGRMQGIKNHLLKAFKFDKLYFYNEALESLWLEWGKYLTRQKESCAMYDHLVRKIINCLGNVVYDYILKYTTFLCQDVRLLAKHRGKDIIVDRPYGLV